MREHVVTTARGIASGLGSLIVALATSVYAAEPAPGDPVATAFAEARAAVEAGRCDEAATRLRGFPELATRSALLAGQCEIRAGRYADALRQLDAVRGAADLTGELVGDVELYRGIALYHLERYTEAGAALEGARGLTRQRAEFDLYTGLLLLRQGDEDRAAPALESASRIAPRLTEPVASYYAGLAWQSAAERSKAREAFRRVIAVDGDGPWGQEARKMLDALEPFPYYARASLGYEFDDNVLLRGDVTQFIDINNPLSTTGESDWRAVWEVDAGVQLFRSDDGRWDGGVTGTYQGNAHFDLSEVNLQYPRIGSYLRHRLGPRTIAQARYEFGHAWIDANPYLRGHTAELALSHAWERRGTTRFSIDLLSNDLRFQPTEVPDNTAGAAPAPGSACVFAPPAPAAGTTACSPPGVNERRERERDGLGYGAALEHRLLLDVPTPLAVAVETLEVGGGYRFRYYDAEGDEWEHFAHVLVAALEFELIHDLRFATRASYEHRDFANPSTFPDAEVFDQEYALSGSDRREDEFVFEGELEKDLTAFLSVSTRYQYLNNESNRAAYDYDRHIWGGYVKVRFD